MRNRNTGDGEPEAAPAASGRTEEEASRIRDELLLRDELLRKIHRPTLGEVIDRLGARTFPGHERLHEGATKALVITVGPSPAASALASISSFAAGDMSAMEAVGLLELVKRDLMSDKNQQRAIEHVLSSPPE